jgi:hypothetical protein
VGSHRVAFRVGAPLLGYEIRFRDGSREAIDVDPGSTYWGLLRETRVFVAATSAARFHALLAADAVLGEDCALAGDQDMDLLNDADDPECWAPARRPCVELGFDAATGTARGEAAVGDFPTLPGVAGGPHVAVLHGYGVPGETLVGQVLLDVTPPPRPSVTPVESCASPDGSPGVRVEWAQVGGFTFYEVEVDGATQARFERAQCDATVGMCSAFVRLDSGTYQISVSGCRPHPRVARGICYRSPRAPVTVPASCLDVSVVRSAQGIDLEWFVPQCTRIFDRVTVEIDGAPAVDIDPEDGCSGRVLFEEPPLLVDCHDFVVRGFVAQSELCCRKLRDCPPDPPQDGFRRGDCDGDRRLTLSDAVCALCYLFPDGPAPSCPDPAPSCLDALDTNDNGRVNIADVSYVLYHLFLAGPEPAAPYAACGPDPSPDVLDCPSGTACP